MEDLDEKLLEEGKIIINGRIDENMYKEFQKKIMYLQTLDELREIEILINSKGGDLGDTFAICDYIEWAKQKGKMIRTVSLGYAHSGAFMILICGNTRIITKNTTLLCHRFYGERCGDHAELIAMRKADDFLYDRMIEHIKKNTKLKTKKKIEEIALRESDAYFTPKEAMKYGFVDQIIGD